jgi:hypothetical protein
LHEVLEEESDVGEDDLFEDDSQSRKSLPCSSKAQSSETTSSEVASARLFASNSIDLVPFSSQKSSSRAFKTASSASLFASESSDVSGPSKVAQTGKDDFTSAEMLMFKLVDRLELLTNTQTKLLECLNKKNENSPFKSPRNKERRLFGSIFRRKLIETFGEKFVIANTEYLEQNMPIIYKNKIGSFFFFSLII